MVFLAESNLLARLAAFARADAQEIAPVRPAIGQRYVARTNYRAMSLGPASPSMHISRGTRLEAIALEEHWDHTNASIISSGRVTMRLRAIDHPVGAVVEVVIAGHLLQHDDGRETERYDLPSWLRAG